MEKKSQFFVPMMVLLLVVASFFVGRLSAQVDQLKTNQNTKVLGDTDPEQPEQTAVTLDQIKGLFSKDVVKFGKEGAQISFVEVSDPSCPFCHVASGKNLTIYKDMGDSGERFKLNSVGGTYVSPAVEMKKLVDEGKATYVWLYSNGHGNGEMATKAMYCANEKGKFWEVHDLLFTADGYVMINETVKNDKTKSGLLAEFLKSAVSVDEMKACLDSGKYDARLQSDLELASSLGANGTPNFFVNETNFAGAYSYTDMESAVNASL